MRGAGVAGLRPTAENVSPSAFDLPVLTVVTLTAVFRASRSATTPVRHVTLLATIPCSLASGTSFFFDLFVPVEIINIAVRFENGSFLTMKGGTNMKGSIRLALVALMAVVLTVPGGASAWSTQGGETLASNEMSVEARAGYPDVWGRVGIPLSADLELLPTAGGSLGLGTDFGSYGFFACVELKYRLVRSGNWHFALVAGPGLVYFEGLHSWSKGRIATGGSYGFRLGFPQMLGTYVVSKKLAVHFGLRIPIAFVRVDEIIDVLTGEIHTKTKVQIPFIMEGALEMQVAERFSLFGGVAFGFVSFSGKTEFLPGFFGGAAFRF